MSSKSTKKFLVSQFGIDANGPRLMVWNASGREVLFAGSPAECERFIYEASGAVGTVK